VGRPLRVEYANAFYHVHARGNERRAIFRDDRDRERFLDLLCVLADRFEVEVWAYVLMPNHYHLVLRTQRPNLSRAMHWLGVAYTNWFNARHDRSGHLFQGRFKCFVVEDEQYLQRLLLYVHRNPLRGGLVERLADYPWSSYRCLAYGRGCLEWFRPGLALGLFGGPREFRRAVQEYSEEDDLLLEDLWHGLLLGSREGLDALAKRMGVQRHEEKPQTRAVLRTALGRSVAESAERWASVLAISAEELQDMRRPKRRVPRPLRDVLIRLVWKEGHARLRDIADYFGMSYPAVTLASQRAEVFLKRHRRLAERLDAKGITEN
jgi:REP element-mobilizing transposase RayT